jgi:hypothetical protein
VPTPPDPLLALIRRVRTRCVLADAGWMFVTAGFVVAVAFVVASLTLRLVPMSISSVTALIAMAVVLIAAVLIWVIRRWPNDARVARRIDEALELRELLASGFVSTGDDAAARSVRAAAVERARHIRTADVPTTMPSTSTFAAAILLLTGAITVNALLNGSLAETNESASLPTRPNRTPAGLMDHDAARRNAAVAAPQSAAPEAAGASIPVGPPTTSTSASTPGDGTVGRTEDGEGRDRGQSDQSAQKKVELTFDAARDASRVEAPGSRGTPGGSSADGATTELQGTRGAVSLGIAGRERSGSDVDARRASADATPPSRAAARIPDRYRDLVRAYFDANTTQPSDAAR